METTQKFRSLVDYSRDELRNDPQIAIINARALKIVNNYGIRYRLNLDFPADYQFGFDDATSYVNSKGRQLKQAYEFFNQDDFFTIMLALNLKPDVSEIHLRAAVRLVKGTAQKDGQDLEWFKLELILKPSKDSHICKSCFISPKKAAIMMKLVDKFANPVVFEGKIDPESAEAATAAEEADLNAI